MKKQSKIEEQLEKLIEKIEKIDRKFDNLEWFVTITMLMTNLGTKKESDKNV